MREVIQMHQVSKRYKNFQAVKDVSLTINKGEIYGFIGLNGAGKTTTIRMLLGMIKPTQGVCYINGNKVSPTNHHIWKNVGHMVETPFAYPELTVQENLDIYRRLRLISNPDAVSDVIGKLHLTRYALTKAGHLSLGNAQRLGIAKALLHEPEILLLDEPVNGLDPAGIVEIRKLLQDLAFHKGVTILISSHLLSEVAKIATKIGIIHEGELIQEIESSALNQRLHRHLIIDTNHNQSAMTKLSTAGYDVMQNENGYIQTSNKSAVKHPDNIARLLVYEGISPIKLTVEEENLESYFLSILKKEGASMS